uniref:FERM and PDZ domain containing 2 n=1 Tax=Canis lupus familiaris TaxID=9615 RepID=A0A8I3P932_CANLF
MSLASVVLASALQVRGEALLEEEIWSLLSLAVERLLEDLREDSLDYVICPWSALLSAAGSLSFQDHVSHIEAAPFKAPELLQGQSGDEQPDASQMHVYALGMTLYWSAGFHVPQNQPLRLREPLHSILLTMCENQPSRRLPLQSVLEACRVHREEMAVYPASANVHVRQLATLVLSTISEVESRVVKESSPMQQDRSYLLRNRLHQESYENPAAWALERLHPCRGGYSIPGIPIVSCPEWTGRFHAVAAEKTHASFPLPRNPLECDFSPVPRVTLGFCQFSMPEFVLLAGEAPVILHLAGSIVTKKGKSYLALRELCVVLLSSQCLEVKCDIMSTAGAIFSAVMSFINLGELTYFGLAYMKGKEFFFLDNETRLCKIAPEGWSEQPQKKTSLNTFTLFLRIKFFISCCAQLQHSQTRHQFYLQLRKDILEEKLYCNDETLLQLAVLALQAEFGNYPEEQKENKAYFRVEDYIPASLIERMTALQVQVEVSEMHCLSPVLWGEDAELEFLRVTQQLPEYGVLVHHVLPEKIKGAGEMALGICAKDVIFYEVKNNSRIATLQFQWRDQEDFYLCMISLSNMKRKKFTITSSISGKKHTFVTNSTKTCKYLLGLCSAQHGFNAQMSSLPAHRHTGHDKCVQMPNVSLAHPAQSKPLTWIQKLSSSENTPFIIWGESTTWGFVSPLGPQNNRRKGFRDPHHGFGFVINEGEEVGKVDPGIFVSSIIPGGPAAKAKKLKPGGQILALNHISLEGFTFDMAVRMIQNSPDSIELIISQSKGICGNTPGKEKNNMANSGVFSTDSLSNGHQGSSFIFMPSLFSFVFQGQGAGSSCPPPPSEINANEIYFVKLVKEDGTLGFSVTGGINTSVPYGGIYMKSIVPGGPAAKEGQIQWDEGWSDRLLQVHEVGLCGLTHKQAVQCLKDSGQVARLVLERRGLRTAQQCPFAKDRMGDECMAVSLATALPGRPAGCVSVTDGPKFEVTLKKNASGLGFSFVQMKRESYSHLKNDLVRINKRLFLGQPAEENGTIAAGDIILAVNGRPIEGLVFQEVLHLLRGASQEVTLLLYRPSPGALPEIDQGWQIRCDTPVLSSDKEFTRATCTDSEQSPSLDQEYSQRENASLDAGESPAPGPESFQRATGEVQWDQDLERFWATSSMHPQDSHPHLCRLQQEMDASNLATSLEKDIRENCYSVCDIRRLESPELDTDDEERDTGHLRKASSSTVENEAYLTINSTWEGQLPCEKCLEADSETIPLPQFCSWSFLSESLPAEEVCDSESEWEDLEEAVDLDNGTLRWLPPTLGRLRLC